MPRKDCFVALARYYGLFESGELKLRRVMERRRNIPEFVRKAQLEMFELLKNANSVKDLAKLESRLKNVHRKYLSAMRYANSGELFIRKQISKTSYSKNTLEASAIKELKRLSVEEFPGMEMEYVIVDFESGFDQIRILHQKF